WLAALTTVLDASALVMVAAEGACARQAGLTFAMARHAVVDLAQVFRTRPRPPPEDRLPAPVLAKLTADLAAAGCPLLAGAAADLRAGRGRAVELPAAAAPPLAPGKAGTRQLAVERLGSHSAGAHHGWAGGIGEGVKALPESGTASEVGEPLPDALATGVKE